MSKMKATSPNVYTQYAARFSTVGRVFGFPVSPECPVAVERGAFLRDNTFGKIYLQLRLRNCGRGIIRSVHLQGVLVNAAGQPMANSRFTASYDEVFCDENGSFGTKNLIMVDAPQKYVQLESVSVVMGDGSAREFAGTEFPKVLQVRPFAVPGPYYDLVDNAGEVMVEPYRYGPDTYLCNCGTLVIRGDVCPHCRKTWQTVSEESSLEGLAARRTRSQTSGNDGIDLSDATAAAGAAAGAAARASRETAQNIQRASRATAVQAVNIFERIRPYFGLMVFGVFMLALLILAYAQPEGSFLWFESYRSRYQWLGLDEITYYEIHNIAMIPLIVVAVLFGPQAGVAFGVISSLLAFMNSAYWWDGRIYAVILFNVLYGFLVGMVAAKLHLSVRDNDANRKKETWIRSAVITLLVSLAIVAVNVLIYDDVGNLLLNLSRVLTEGYNNVTVWREPFWIRYTMGEIFLFYRWIIGATLLLMLASRALFLAFPAEPGLSALICRVTGRNMPRDDQRQEPALNTTGEEDAAYDQLNDIVE